MTVNPDDPHHIPIVEEQVVVEKTAVVTDRVRITTHVESRNVVVEDQIARGQVEIERVTVDREVDEAPAARHEGDVLVISIIEERLVKRLFVIEEVRIRQSTTREAVSIPTTLRAMHATVEHPKDTTAEGPLKWQI